MGTPMMKRILVTFIFISVLISACATVIAPAPTTPPTALSTVVPTVSLIATSIPTMTPVPTLIPMPEGAVESADGDFVYVEGEKIQLLHPESGVVEEKSILDIAFLNVNDGAYIVKQMHPEYYKDGQELLRKTLLPEGVMILERYRRKVEEFVVGSDPDPGIYDASVIGYVLDVTVVNMTGDSMLGSKKVIVMYCALMGADIPIPVVAGLVEENGEMTSFLIQISSSLVGTDANETDDWGSKPVQSPWNLEEFASTIKGKRVGMYLLAFADPDKAGQYYGLDFAVESLGPDYAIFVHDSVIRHSALVGWWIKIANESGAENDHYRTAGEFLTRVMEDSTNSPEGAGPGFLINNWVIFIYSDI